jgi:hypothetical protein
MIQPQGGYVRWLNPFRVDNGIGTYLPRVEATLGFKTKAHCGTSALVYESCTSNCNRRFESNRFQKKSNDQSRKLQNATDFLSGLAADFNFGLS